MKSANAFCIVRAYAATEQERHIAIVGFKYAPVELFAAASHCLAFRVEDKGINAIRISPECGDGLATFHTNCFPYLHIGQGMPQLSDECSGLMAMQLYDIKSETGHTGYHFLCRRIDEDTHFSGQKAGCWATGIGNHSGRSHAHIAGRLVPKYQSDVIYTECCNFTNVVCLTQATHFDNHIFSMNCFNANPGSASRMNVSPMRKP